MLAGTKKSLLAMALGALVFVGVLTTGTRPTEAQPNQQQAVSQLSLSDSLRMARAENEALQVILHAIQSIDTARQNELIQWIITDRSVRSRVISALRKSGFAISPNSVAELTVTQKPQTGGGDPASEMQLLRLVIESIGVYGEPNIRRILGQDLYEKIRAREGYEYTLISTEPVQNKIQFVYLDASLFGGNIIFKSGFGFGMKVGNDYVGYPFWLPGTIGTYGLLRRGTTDFRLGLEWPLGESGLAPFTISGGLQIRPRKLMGTMAFSTQVDQQVDLLAEQSGKIHFGLEFMNAFTPTINTFPIMARNKQFETYYHGGDKDSLFYLAMSAHGYVSYRFPESFLRGAYVQLGAGTHAIQAVTVGTDPKDPLNMNNQELNLVKRTSYFDPLVKVGYVHNSETGDDYGVSVQYCNTLLTDAWVKLFPWLQLEAKYATVVGRDPQKWEWKDYVIVSPKLTLNF